MKRWMLILLSLAILTSGCAPKPAGKLALEPSDVVSLQAPDGVSFVTTRTVFPLDTEEISAVLINGSLHTLTYGVDFALETLSDGAWMRVPYREDVAWIAIAHVTEAGQKADITCPLGIFPELPEGTYRIVKHAFCETDGGSEEIVMAAEFILSDDPAEATSHPQFQIPNPLVEVENAAAFAKLDLYIDAPEQAADVKYIIISDMIAEVRFTLDGRSYTYRAAHTGEEIHGVYETFDGEELGLETDAEGWYASIRVRTVDAGKSGALATWRYGTVCFSLYTSHAVEAGQIGELASRLAEPQFQHHMPAA